MIQWKVDRSGQMPLGVFPFSANIDQGLIPLIGTKHDLC